MAGSHVAKQTQFSCVSCGQMDQLPIAIAVMLIIQIYFDYANPREHCSTVEIVVEVHCRN